MNLVEMIMKSAGGDTLGKLAGALGADEKETHSALSAAVPALLSGLGAVASKPQGAEKLWGAVQETDDSLLGNLAGMLGGGQQSMLSGIGTKMLEGIFGKGMLSSLIGVLASFLGGKTSLVTKLLPLLAPVVMGVLKKQTKADNLNQGGLVNLLMGQKNNISQAMPSGLASALSGASGLGDLAGFLPGSGSARPAATQAVHSTPAKASSPMGWLLPLIGVLAIGGLLWSMMSGKGEKAVDDVKKTVEEGVDRVDGAVDLVTNTTTSFRDYFNKMDSTLDGVTDAASAEKALPTLQEMSKNFDTLSAAYNKVPADVRGPIAEMIRAQYEAQEAKKAAVLEKPGVGDILKNVLNALFTKISDLLTA